MAYVGTPKKTPSWAACQVWPAAPGHHGAGGDSPQYRDLQLSDQRLRMQRGLDGADSWEGEHFEGNHGAVKQFKYVIAKCRNRGLNTKSGEP